jgi:hypothetical protein
MKVELLYFEGCPGYEKTVSILKKVLSEEGLEAEVETTRVETNDEAHRLKFPGSPTVRVDGRDLFEVKEREVCSLGCRLYATPEGLKDHPAEEMLRAAIKGLANWNTW